MLLNMVVFISIIIFTALFTINSLISGSFIHMWYDHWIAIPIGLGWFLAFTTTYFVLLYALSLTIDLKKPATKRSGFYRYLLNQTVSLILILGRVEIQASGLEKIKGLPPFLLIANHKSNFDPFIAIATCPKLELAYVAKPAIFKIPITGKIVHKCFFLPINREDDREAVKTIRKASELIKEGVVSVGIYPEGTRSKTDELLPFRNGSFKIAKWANCPVVIARTTGTEKIAHQFARLHTKTTFEILDVLTAEEVASMSTWEIGQHARDLIIGNNVDVHEERRKKENDIPCSV